MAFGQQSGPPASHRQVQRLLELLADAGYAGFREARGPLGFTQRQGGGKFTGPEADAFIAQLEAEAEGGGGGGGDTPPEPAPAPAPKARAKASARAAAAPATTPTAPADKAEREAKLAKQLQAVPAGLLATELERRGWIVIPPEDLTTPESP